MKIALIEDRYKRQELFIKESSFDFEKYTQILDNIVLDDFYHLANEIIHDSFNLTQYDMIICHKSIQIEEKKDSNSTIISRLKNYCKKHQITLVLFSGGISVNLYDNSEFEILELNSKTFYSKNLDIFLEATKNSIEDVLMLCYGEHWKENVVANILEKTNLFIFDIENYQTLPSDYQIDDNLLKIDYNFYQIQNKTVEELKKFTQSLKSYFLSENSRTNKSKSLAIHHDNICSFELFDEIEKFNSTEDIDKYINELIIEIKEKDFEMIFIKDNLSSNYLELLGLRVAYHIRLTDKLGNKRFVPIVIVSDFSIEQLCRFDEMANILFTPNFYLCKNTKEDIEQYQQLDIYKLSIEQYNQEFLNKIKIDPPKDYLSHHSIANEWSIYRWVEFLDVDTDTTKINKAKIENMLYFKYLKAKYHIKDQESDKTINLLTKKGKVLLIDDDWDKGWKDILNTALSKDGLEFKSLEINYKDKEWTDGSYKLLNKMLTRFDPDVIILDLRLSQDDHDENKDIENYTGIKILQKIHKINEGIQVIMLTATSKSTILEKLYEKKILGYIKKEHPDDTSINTVENINKLIKLVDRGLKNKYLKKVWSLQQEILKLNILNSEKTNYKRIRFEINNIFNILDSNLDKKITFFVLSLYNVLELLISEFGYSTGRAYSNIIDICNNNDIYGLDTELSKIICTRNYLVHIDDEIKPWCRKNTIKEPDKDNIINWIEIINKVLSKIKV